MKTTRRGGWITVQGKKSRPGPVERFWHYTEKRGPDECWLWTGQCYENPKAPYGRIFVDGKKVCAHQFSYELHFGKVPDGMEVMHKCDTHNCVNPRHLEAGTHAKNMRDCIGRGRFFFAVGERNGKATITEEVAREIKRSYVPGYGRAATLAKKLGISRSTLHAVAHGHTWKRVVV